jgi:RNA recognition motif-containing protein
MNIYVGNMSFQTSEAQLHDLFAAHGEVESVKIINDNFTGRPKGFAFVEMNNHEEAEKAIEQLNNMKVDTHFIIVNEARPKADKPSYNSAPRSNNRRY